MRNFLLALLEVVLLIFFIFISWLIVKFPEHIVYIYSSITIIIILLNFINSYFLSILILILSIFLGVAAVILMPTEKSFDKIMIVLEILSFIIFYYITLKLETDYEKNKALYSEREENLEKEISEFKINIEKLQNDIYNTVVKIQNYKLVEEIVNKLSSLNDFKQLKKYINEIFKNLLPKFSTKFILNEDEIKKDSIDHLIIDYCKKENGNFYVQNLSFWLENFCDNIHIKKYFQKHKKISSIFCTQLKNKKENKNSYIIFYSEIPIVEDNLRLILMLCSFITITIFNIETFNYVKDLAITDSLTGLYIQKYFKELLNEEIRITKNYKRDLSLAIFDIDDFKKVNDIYGHNIGDEVLLKFANILKTRLRETDIVARYGGDEFAVIFKDTDENIATKICEEIRNIVEEEIVFISKDAISKKISVSSRLKFTVSCGVAKYIESFKTMEDFLNYVDKLLYKAKSMGKNKVINILC